jgi:hypothetical protein
MSIKVGAWRRCAVITATGKPSIPLPQFEHSRAQQQPLGWDAATSADGMGKCGIDGRRRVLELSTAGRLWSGRNTACQLGGGARFSEVQHGGPEQVSSMVAGWRARWLAPVLGQICRERALLLLAPCCLGTAPAASCAPICPCTTLPCVATSSRGLCRCCG